MLLVCIGRRSAGKPEGSRRLECPRDAHSSMPARSCVQPALCWCMSDDLLHALEEAMIRSTIGMDRTIGGIAGRPPPRAIGCCGQSGCVYCSGSRRLRSLAGPPNPVAGAGGSVERAGGKGASKDRRLICLVERDDCGLPWSVRIASTAADRAENAGMVEFLGENCMKFHCGCSTWYGEVTRRGDGRETSAGSFHVFHDLSRPLYVGLCARCSRARFSASEDGPRRDVWQWQRRVGGGLRRWQRLQR